MHVFGKAESLWLFTFIAGFGAPLSIIDIFETDLVVLRVVNCTFFCVVHGKTVKGFC